MIAKVVHGWRAGGLLAYLFGPGVSDEHVRPRVVASWDGRDSAWQPEQRGPGEHDLELGPLIRAMQAPAVAAGLPLRAPSDGGRGYVWHCSVRLADTDRVLPDEQWADIARELLHDAGIAERDDPGGPRWVAVRHADDHIHIAAVLVRQDSSKRFWPRNDYPKLRASAQRIEARLGLTVTPSAEGAASKRPTRGELAKSDRESRRPARDVLRGAARRAALRASSVEEFEKALQKEGLLVEIRRAPSGDAIGYKVAVPPDLLASGEPVFYSGSKLAPDLSLPRLQQRWAETGGQDQRRIRFSTAASQVNRAAEEVESGHVAPEGAADGLADMLTSLSAVTDPSERFRYAAAADRVRGTRPQGKAVHGGADLKVVARRLLLARRLAIAADNGGEELTLALARLALAIAERTRSRPWARAAYTAAAQLVAGAGPGSSAVVGGVGQSEPERTPHVQP
ncbi:relaxase/mobilization nuclease domain-containing protein [Pseudonocardia oroxyli]|uniref:Relaxase/Mobilisation nuclease domain-containing protein n=1 Tax=Pseudonocardia oroxyli TaxID=366584 RepID=A0A1G7X1U1_PSEOR|nr:relaxase/mobilization nuclease domain-containing protein [Pseudonocardia oroxyli]SDG77510.1 Relaxase/Mobilisation nuclease domain-containing protein [Pseudonocardia oroxyli]